MKSPEFWYEKKSALAYLLSPLSFLYQWGMSSRRWLYRHKIFSSTHFSTPIIVIGNLTVGGTGKTPVVIALANHLRTKNFRPGIVSRGYGGHSDVYPKIVFPDDNPWTVGDEALLLVRETQCPMVIDPDRVRAAKTLLKQNDCDVIISDDGLQHLALARNIEVVVLDGNHLLGNRFCLPAGPLRESVHRLETVDAIIVNGETQEYPYSFRLKPALFHQVSDMHNTCTLRKFQNKKIHAVAGIGNPDRFFKLLHDLELNIETHPFSDHYKFTAKDFEFAEPDSIVLMTAKDAVKCEKFAPSNYWYLSVEAELPESFFKMILKGVRPHAPREV